MDFAPASVASQAAFVAVLLAVMGAILAAVNHAYRSSKVTNATAILLGLWLGVQSALVLSGAMDYLPLNGLPFFFGPVVVVWVGLALSPVGRRLATTIPPGPWSRSKPSVCRWSWSSIGGLNRAPSRKP